MWNQANKKKISMRPEIQTRDDEDDKLTIFLRGLKQKLYMHNTFGEVLLTNISRATNYYHDFYSVSKTKVCRLSSTQCMYFACF